MLAWLKYTKDFLLELLRLDGRGEQKNQLKCSGCSKGEPRYRCRDCLGGSLFCADCIADNHRCNLFHYIEVLGPLFYSKDILANILSKVLERQIL
jgi:hypothetical protein